MLRGAVAGRGIDLVGMALGLVPEGELLDGSAIQPGDRVIMLASSGIHSNGLSLARRVLLHRFRLDGFVDELGTTLGEELLRPTRIYVPQVEALRAAGVRARAMAHITGDGFLNLRRVEAPVGFELTDLPELPPLFRLIERFGEVERAEMRTVFNMGLGFAVVVAEPDAKRAREAIEATGVPAWDVGHAVRDPERRVRIPGEGLVGHSKQFVRE
jgi:phosphoribosylformylglycinamidine cyclo-ligase